MKKNKITKILSLTLALFLLAAAGITSSGCSDKKNTSSVGITAEQKEVGTGKTEFNLNVTEKDGTVASFKIHTDKKTVGDALKEVSLIDGQMTEYGLTVTTVNGNTYDYNKDSYYWAFYVGDQYAQKGVSDTEITDGETYGFKVEKA